MSDLQQLARTVAQAHGLDPTLVCAVCEQESSWNPWAIRHEPRFEARYVVPLHLADTETVARSVSWGLMQIMGEVAREFGYTGDLARLCDPTTGLEYGCLKLKQCVQRANAQAHQDEINPTEQALLYWNGGGDLDYGKQVMARMPKYANPPSPAQ